MLDNIKIYLQQNTQISEEDILEILACFKTDTIKKNQILVRQNKTCKHLFFVNKGGLRVVCTKDDGQEWTRQLAVENQFITIFPSFIEQKITESYLQAIEASEVAYISHTDFIKLRKQILEWEQLYTKVLEKTYIDSIKRIENLITMSGKNLYEDFKRNNTDLIPRLSNKILASYLGVSQETLSRLKK